MTTEAPLLWVTNIPTPYRASLWTELARRHPLTVALLADREPNRDWAVDLDEDLFKVERLQARVLGRPRETALYAPSVGLMRLIKGRPAAVVLDGWETPAYLSALWQARSLSIPVIASYRSTLATHRFRAGPVSMVRRWFFHSASAVVTAGPASTDAVRSMGVPRDRIVEGFNTVDVRSIAAAAEAARSRIAARPGHHFIYVGQLIQRKNIDGLIKAFASCREADDTLSIVGTGPCKEELQRLAEAVCLPRQVRFLGHLEGESLVLAYAASHTLALPSHSEVWGLVVNEALAAGLSVVVSRTAGIAPSISGMPGVVLTDPHPASLAAGLLQARKSWAGHQTDHPIVQNTPDRLASIVLGAVRSSEPQRSAVWPAPNQCLEE